MYIYMDKRVPKLCRMKRLDVSQNSHFSFSEENPFISPIPFSFYPPFLMSQFLMRRVKTVFSK